MIGMLFDAFSLCTDWHTDFTSPNIPSIYFRRCGLTPSALGVSVTHRHCVPALSGRLKRSDCVLRLLLRQFRLCDLGLWRVAIQLPGKGCGDSSFGCKAFVVQGVSPFQSLPTLHCIALQTAPRCPPRLFTSVNSCVGGGNSQAVASSTYKEGLARM